MRKSLFFLALLLLGCGGDGVYTFAVPGTGSPPTQHVPAISELGLSPNTVVYMEGDGTVVVTAQVEFRDNGRDIQALWVRLPDGTSIQFNESVDTATGTLAEEFTMSTQTVGALTVELWLVDKAGDSSEHESAAFDVVWTAETDEWTNRLSGLPYVLNDVVWDGHYFIAVGDTGAVLTSADGVTWTEQETGADFDIFAVASDGTDVVAAGEEMQVLLSSDHGQSWIIKSVGQPGSLRAVTINASQIVAGGMAEETSDAFIVRSVDRGESWMVVESLPMTGHWVTEIVYGNGLFVAGTDALSSENDARVLVSVDGNLWHDIILRDEFAATHTILHDGNQFIAAGSSAFGSHSTAGFVSTDGYNWAELQMPVLNVDYLSAAWNGSKLVVAGRMEWWWQLPSIARPVGISSTDGGVTWDIFNIDGFYQSRGMAWGNGRFVSVGQSTLLSGEGAIYTAD